MIYMSADNNELERDISEYADFSITRMSMGVNRRNPNVNISIFCDGRYKRYGRSVTQANYFELSEDGMRNVENLGETNASSLDNFKKFIDRATKHSSEKNILIFWGHSAGLEFLEDSPAGLLADESTSDNNNAMSIDDLVESVKYAKERLGQKLDLVGLDVCSLMYIELANRLKDHTKYLGGSQSKQNAFSWDYKSLVSRVMGNTHENMNSLIDWLIKGFELFYDYEWHEMPLSSREERGNDTFSIVNLDEMDKVKEAFNTFEKNLFDLQLHNRSSADVLKIINNVISPSRIIGCEDGIDLYSFLQRLKTLLTSFQITSLDKDIDNLLNLLDDFVTGYYSRGRFKSAKGISIRDYYIKRAGTSISPALIDDFKDYNFQNENNNWFSFLKNIYDQFPNNYFLKK